ncbi:hypothetical protein B0H21DRAFT_702082, partial [Amylocystis lapponica]
RDHNLLTALINWRNTTAVAKFGDPAVKNNGGKLFLPMPILKRIVECARAGKISSLDQLKKETSWRSDWVTEYGSEIINIVRIAYPPHPPPPATILVQTRTPTGGESNGGTSTDVIRKRRAPTCSRCHEVGHTSEFFSVHWFSSLARCSLRSKQELRCAPRS